MDDDLWLKILRDKSLELLKKPNYDVFEKAVIIKAFIDGRKGTIRQLESELGIGRKELYKATQILKAPSKVLEMVNDGVVDGNTVNRVIYHLKDKTKVEEVVEKAVKEGLSVDEIESYVARCNNSAISENQVIAVLWKTKRQLEQAIKIKFKPTRVEDAKELIQETRILLESIEQRFQRGK